MYFQVNAVAEITNLSGRQIRSEFLNKKEVKGYKSLTKHTWPIQQIPALDSLRIWVKYITKIAQCCKNGIINKDWANG
jgi:hypothetical protein